MKFISYVVGQGIVFINPFFILTLWTLANSFILPHCNVQCNVCYLKHCIPFFSLLVCLPLLDSKYFLRLGIIFNSCSKCQWSVNGCISDAWWFMLGVTLNWFHDIKRMSFLLSLASFSFFYFFILNVLILVLHLGKKKMLPTEFLFFISLLKWHTFPDAYHLSQLRNSNAVCYCLPPTPHSFHPSVEWDPAGSPVFYLAPPPLPSSFN